jgi:hypothetical protein
LHVDILPRVSARLALAGCSILIMRNLPHLRKANAISRLLKHRSPASIQFTAGYLSHKRVP